MAASVSSLSASLAGREPGTPTTSTFSNEEMEKKLEALNAREAKVAKREKELAEKMKEYDRKLKNIEAEEERLGSINMREIQLEAAKTELAEKTALLKKKEKQVRDQELVAAERERVALELEAVSTQRKQEYDVRQEALDAAEAHCAKATAAADELFRSSTARAEENAATARILQRRSEEADALDRVLRRRELQCQEDNADVTARRKVLKEKEDECEKLSQQLAQRQTTISSKEFAFGVERERLNQRKAKLDEMEKESTANLQVSQTKKDETVRSHAEAEALKNRAQQRLDEANSIFHDAAEKMKAAEQARSENLRFQAELAHTNTEQSKLEIELRRKEKRLNQQQATIEATEQRLSLKEQEVSGAELALSTQERRLKDDSESLGQRESRLNASLAELQQSQERLRSVESVLQRRAKDLDGREKELVDWMKEMEWREMMLGEKEDMSALQDTTGGAAAAGSLSAAAGGGHRPKAEGGLVHADLKNVYGKTLISVQMRRLKDQYISAQMRHLQHAISVGQDAVIKTAKTRVRPRCGVAPMHSSAADVDADFHKYGEIERLRMQVHHESLQFVRTVSKLRAFDKNENNSIEQQEQLQAFTEEERMVISMASNLEYFFRIHEGFYMSRMTSPLDDKDQSRSAQDLVSKLTDWWVEVREHMRVCFSRLLGDRHAYLEKALAILSAKEETLAATSRPHTSSSGRGVLTLPPVAAQAGDPSVEAAPTRSHARLVSHLSDSPILLKRGGGTLLKNHRELSCERRKPSSRGYSSALVAAETDDRLPGNCSGNLVLLVSNSSNAQTSTALVPHSAVVDRPPPHSSPASRGGDLSRVQSPFGSPDPTLEMCLVQTGRVAHKMSLRGEPTRDHPLREFDVSQIVIDKAALRSPYK